MSPATSEPRPTLLLARRTALAAAILAAATSPALAIAGKGGKLEFALDAPWRIEPTRDAAGNTTFGAIPIQISIHDALFSALDERVFTPHWTSEHHAGRFVDFYIVQVNTLPGGGSTTFPSQRFGLLDLDEIERTTGVWQFDLNDPCLDSPQTEVCHLWSNPDCAASAQWIRGTTEWHAIFHYTPRGNPAPGTTVHLQVMVRLSREHTAYPPAFPGPINLEVTLNNLEEDPAFTEDGESLLHLVNEVAVRLGDEPLPRFGNDWLYGDLHYHSQGTDNEGESAYSYRGVLAAMGALGLDFVFATEHASDSKQIVDVDAGWSIPPTSTQTCGLRDMSPGRFALLHAALHGTTQNPDGANRGVMQRPDGRLPQTYLSHGGVPQIFLGGEVDVIPELGVEELIVPRPDDLVVVNGIVMAEGHAFALGDGLRYELTNLCGGAENLDPFGGSCYRDRVLEDFGEAYLLKDIQGLNEFHHARQHLIYLPGRQDDPHAFVSSRTEKYGGGGRLLFRLYEDRGGVVPEIERKGGYFFLAHPVNSPSRGNKGPDMVPYSEYQLRQLLRSPAFLGLQFWNEDTRLYAEAMEAPPPMEDRGDVLGTDDIIDVPDGRDGFAWDDGLFTLSTNDAGAWNPQWQESRASQFMGRLYHGAYTWDRMLLWGLGTNLWFTRGCEPRKVFMAGGSDAHGDFNYRREGYLHGTDAIVDTAIGKPRNLVRAGAPAGKPIGLPGNSRNSAVPHSQEQIVEALRSGEFCVTDGPALRISIGDTPMGGVHYLEGTRFTVRVEWKSTTEFGPLEEIHLYAGAGSSGNCAGEDRLCPEVGVVYTPGAAGPRNTGDEHFPTPGPYSSGPPFTIYRTDEELRINAASEGAPLGYEGSATVSLGNGDLRLANGGLADRYFVRAVGRTAVGGCGERAALLVEGCQPRFAFTNPVWVVPGSLAAPPPLRFQRGDANGDGRLDLSDALATLGHLFVGNVTLDCDRAADTDANDRLEISDALRTLGHLFLGSAPPEPPYPGCGVDPSPFKRLLTCRSAPLCGTGSEPAPAPACLADLTITRFEKLGPLEIGELTGFTQPLGITVTNRGGKVSGPCRIALSHGPSDFAFGTLEPGESRGFRAEARFPESYLGRVIQLTARVDSEADVEEVSEDNNRSASVVIDFPDHCEPLDPGEIDPGEPDPGRFCWDDPPTPDLVALELRLTGKVAPGAGGTYDLPLEVTVENRGTGTAGAFQVALRLASDIPIRTPAVATPWSSRGLAAGATETFRATVSLPGADYRGETHSFQAQVDPPSTAAPAGSVSEKDETNNESPPITVRFP